MHSYLTVPATDTALRSLRGPNEYRHEGEHTCFVYELNLAADPPTFTPINYMKDVIFMGFAGSRERIIVESVSGDLIGIWDVEQNTAVSWDTSVEDVGQDVSPVRCTGILALNPLPDTGSHRLPRYLCVGLRMSIGGVSSTSIPALHWQIASSITLAACPGNGLFRAANQRSCYDIQVSEL